MSPVLKAIKISKQFTHPTCVNVLDQISLEVSAGETCAIVGKSGEGKTTLLHLLGALDEPTSGMIEICGQLVTSRTSSLIRNKYLGFVFQAYYLLEECTSLENVLMPARIGGKSTQKGSSTYLRALELLEEVGLSHRVHFSAKLLSGGEKQRVCVARALMNDPSIILADEPSGNLDRTHSQIIYQLLLDSAIKQGKALVVVTHDLELASRCQKTYALQDGKLV
jgi:lipoprotein-releasing system ATP-binding protein